MQNPTLHFQGKVWTFDDNVSTDLMMPGLVRSRIMSFEDMAPYCMHANRPDWAAQVQTGDIIVAGRNFGCGSSRPAARILQALGISVVVADSLSRLFFRNSVNVGFPVLICPGVSAAFQESHLATVDLETGLVTNLTTGTTLQGEALPSDSPPYQLLKAGGLDPFLKEQVARLNAADQQPT